MTRFDRICLVAAVIAVAVVVTTYGCDEPRFRCRGYDEMACR